MKNKAAFLLLSLIAFSGLAQIKFQQGYFIDNSDKITHCLIKNMDWNDNPTFFEYKLSEKDDSKMALIANTKEFGIDKFSKYIRANVRIDRSSEDIEYMSQTKAPIFTEEQLFLEVLIEGNANLYYYEQKSLRRFFFSLNKGPIEQLIFKSYKTIDNQIGQNNEFRAQLWKSLKCSTLQKYHFESLNYFENQLLKIFEKYNSCLNSDFKNFQANKTKGYFNASLKVRASSNSLDVVNEDTNLKNIVDFGSNINIEFGFELETVLGFNNNKWALLVDFNYQSFKGETTTEPFRFVENTRTHTIDYKSVEVGFGVRHYFFLNDQSKLFLNAHYVVDLPLNKSVLTETDNPVPGSVSIELSRSTNGAFGFGYKYNDKYSLEFRFETSRYIFDPPRRSNYGGISLILGYTIL